MAKKEKKPISSKPMNNKILIWIIVAIIILIALFFIFKAALKEGNISNKANTNIDSIDIGVNPDIIVDDFNSLPISEEEINT